MAVIGAVPRRERAFTKRFQEPTKLLGDFPREDRRMIPTRRTLVALLTAVVASLSPVDRAHAQVDLRRRGEHLRKLQQLGQRRRLPARPSPSR